MAVRDIVQAAAGAGAAEGAYIEDVFGTYVYTGNGAARSISNDITLGDIGPESLVGKTIGSLGGDFSASIGNVNNGSLADIAYCPNTAGYFDIYVDMEEPVIVTGYDICPQYNLFHMPTAFTVHGSNDGSSWTSITSFSSITTGDWVAYQYRRFSFSNSTAYRYWRVQNTTFGANNLGVSMGEWRLITNRPGNGQGGLVWIKQRDSSSANHSLFDTERGANYRLITNNTNASTLVSGMLTSFDSNGFTLGADTSSGDVNTNTKKYASWTFRKAPKFFDVVTWTGNGTNPRQIAHNLGSVPGCIIIKSTTRAENWTVYHASLGNTGRLALNTTDVAVTGTSIWASTSPTDTHFTVSADNLVNFSGAGYVAYLFAHDAGGFGDDGTESVIKCGLLSEVGYYEADLGWEPQWVLLKQSGSGGSSPYNNWHIFDNMRGFGSPDVISYSSNSKNLYANSAGLEATDYGIIPTANGFKYGSQYPVDTIYVAIRKGPMRTPTAGTSVYSGTYFPSNSSTNATIIESPFDVDLTIVRADVNQVGDWYWQNRLAGNQYLYSNLSNLEASSTSRLDVSRGFIQTITNSSIGYGISLRRTPKVFDVVCYLGNSTIRNVPHNLGVAPEMLIVKGRNFASNWFVYHTGQTGGIDALHSAMFFNGNQASFDSQLWKNYDFNASTFSLDNDNNVNGSGNTYVAYLFATLAGVSKVGSYTGTGTTLQVDCGFSAGARFVLIKRTDSTGDWWLFETKRGIGVNTDAYMYINTNAAQNSGINDYIDPYSPGFEITSTAPAGLNASGGSYIYLAIA